MYGFEWKDQRGIEGTGFVRALRSLLTAHLPSLLPSLSSNIARSLESEILLGREANSQNDEFNAAALEFPQAVVFAAEILRITPTFMKPFVASLASGRHRAAKILTKHLGPVVKARLEARDRMKDKEKPALQIPTPVDPESLALLDGFVQESMRLNTSDASQSGLFRKKRALSDME
ncbi:MAG: hypothetical protein Q9225_004432 [Loekoesia sp. 1 TL-2023]